MDKNLQHRKFVSEEGAPEDSYLSRFLSEPGLAGPDGDDADDVEDVYADPQCVMCPRGEPGPLGIRKFRSLAT